MKEMFEFCKYNYFKYKNIIIRNNKHINISHIKYKFDM